MAQGVNLPGVGPVSRRALLLGGGAAVVVMGLLWWRKRSTPAPANTTGTSGTTDTTGLDTSAYDPYGLGYYGAGGGGAITGPSIPTTTLPTTNPQWTAQVMQLLGGVVDPSALSSALGKYLTGSPVNDTEVVIIDQAIAAAGYPPVSGPNGYPPAIRQSPAGGQTPPPPTGGGGGTTGGGDWTTHTTVHEGERLSQVLAYGGGMAQGDFEAHNPGIRQFYRPYIAGRGYVAQGTPGAVIALNTGHDIAVLVKTGGW